MSVNPIYEQINFLPPWYVQRLNNRRWIERKIAITVLFVAIICSIGFVTHNQQSHLQRHLSALEGQVIAAQGKLMEVSKLQAAEQELERSLRIYRQLARPISFHHVNSTIAALTPSNIYLSELDARIVKAERDVPAPGEATKGGEPKMITETYEVIEIELRGSAPTNLLIANYVGQLAGSNLFRNVKMVKSRESEQEGAVVRQFEIQMQVPLDRTYRLQVSHQEVADASE